MEKTRGRRKDKKIREKVGKRAEMQAEVWPDRCKERGARGQQAPRKASKPIGPTGNALQPA